MTATAQDEKPVRAPLSRQQVLRAALDFVDQHGLAELSMHKLGAALGVKAMSLYKHVANKDEVLDGIVELMWDEIPPGPPAGDWREVIRQLAGSLRELVHRHPAAAPLVTSRQAFLERPLLICQGVLRAMREGGIPEECAVAMLRTVIPYGFGFALAELALPPPPPPGPDSDIAAIRQLTGLLSAQVSDELVRTALLVCGECDMTSQFGIGVDLMIRGLDAYLQTPEEAAQGNA